MDTSVGTRNCVWPGRWHLQVQKPLLWITCLKFYNVDFHISTIEITDIDVCKCVELGPDYYDREYVQIVVGEEQIGSDDSCQTNYGKRCSPRKPGKIPTTTYNNKDVGKKRQGRLDDKWRSDSDW